MRFTKKELEDFKNRLLDLKAQLSGALRDASEDVRSPEENRGYSQHQADEGTDDFERTISINVSTSELETLRQIERALEKIEEGTYGVCDMTEEEIPKKRLEAIPYATRTAAAQEKFEKGET